MVYTSINDYGANPGTPSGGYWNTTTNGLEGRIFSNGNDSNIHE